MPRMSRLFLAATLSTLAALLPVTAFASTPPLIENVVGAQLPIFGPCSGGTTSTFAGYGTTSGQLNAAFSTTICHEALTPAPPPLPPWPVHILGGSFILAMSSLTLVGRYTGGTVEKGVVTGNYFCKEVFHVTAGLGPPTSSVPHTTSIAAGSSADGFLTHYGVREGSGCHAKAATITGIATLYY